MRIVYIVAPAIVLTLMLAMLLFVNTIESPHSVHCSDCPSKTCLCIQGNEGEWMLSPEVGDVDEEVYQ